MGGNNGRYLGQKGFLPTYIVHVNIPINFQSAKIVDFMMPRHEVIKLKIQHFVVVTATL